LIDLKLSIAGIDAVRNKLVSKGAGFKKKMAEKTGVEPA
jgi:hypothetical protein